MTPKAFMKPAAAAMILAGSLALTACGSDDTAVSSDKAAKTASGTASGPTTSITAATTTETTTTTATSTATGTAGMGAPTGTGIAGKVDANKASKTEMADAFKSAGVTNAEKWANEVEEYRPYTKDDLSPKVTKQLSKYTQDKATIDKIIACLEVS